MLLTTENIDQDINQVWHRFEQVLTRANGLINYKPVFSDYFYEALEEFYADNVQYVEVRALLPAVSLIALRRNAHCVLPFCPLSVLYFRSTC